MQNKLIREYVSKVKENENEMALLRDDRKEIDADYKEQIDIKAVKAAIRILKIRAKMDEDLVDAVINALDEAV